MYSSGEDVLGNIGHDQGNVVPSPSYIWGSQEKLKGIMTESTDWFVGSAVCGWGINENYNYAITNQGQVVWFKMEPQDAFDIPVTNLIAKPFFLKSYPDLFNANSATAQAYASANKKALLAQAIPARTFAVGRNDTGGDTVIFNINMNTEDYQDGWPNSRGDNLSWRHSDIKNVSYLYNYEVYNYIVTEGDLQ